MMLRKGNKLLRVLNYSFYDVPCPANLSFMWTFGSALGIFYVVQLVSGFLLSCHYIPSSMMAFDSVESLRRDVGYGWAMRNIHANGASFMMALIYFHIGRGMYFGSYVRLMEVWNSGVLLLLMTMAIAFFGYVLPWGQMSYWGATVITKLFEVIPWIGGYLVEILWGDFAVSGHTLNRFYSIHFVLPFIMAPIIIVHLYFLHEKGSSNPLGVDSSVELVSFYPYYVLMDVVAVWFWGGVFMIVVFGYPVLLGNPLNFERADPLKTPVHIEPEWYFLPLYAILRSIPHKGLGIFTMFFSIIVLLLIPHSYGGLVQGVGGHWWREVWLWLFFINWVALGWIGACPMGDPYLVLGALHSLMYFAYFLLDIFLVKMSKALS